MEILKIILKNTVLSILVLAGFIILCLIPNALMWLSTQIGYITTMAILVGIIYIIATSNNK